MTKNLQCADGSTPVDLLANTGNNMSDGDNNNNSNVLSGNSSNNDSGIITCSNVLIKSWETKIKNISELQNHESHLLETLQRYSQDLESNDKATIAMDKSRIVQQIKAISQLREQSMADLNNILANSQCNLIQSRQNLADQTTMIKIVNEELKTAEKIIADLEDVRNSRKRMVEITDYEKKRYASHKDIFKNIAFCGLGILASLYLAKKGFPVIGKLGITLSIVVCIILTIKKMIDNGRRDNMRWDRFNFGSASPDQTPQPSVYEYDVNSAIKLKDDLLGEAKHVGNEVSNEATKIRKEVSNKF